MLGTNVSPSGFAADGDAAFMITTYGPGSTEHVRSVDGGRTWPAPSYLTFGYLKHIASRRDTWIAAVSALGDTCVLDLLRSTDAGESWSRVSLERGDGGPGLSSCFWERIAADGNGNWLAAWSSSGLRDGGWVDSLVLARSSDDGETWTRSELFSTTESVRLPLPFVAEDGRGLVAWLAGGDLLVSSSSEFGETWSAPSVVTTVAEHWDSVQIAFGEEDWVAAWVAESEVFVARSLDAGATWTAPKIVGPYLEPPQSSYRNLRLARGASGDLLLVWSAPVTGESHGGGTDLVWSSSSDGTQWSAPVLLDASARGDTGWDWIVDVAHVRDDVWAAIWSVGVFHEGRGWGPGRSYFARTGGEACGDGELGSDELCDDGNTADGDGCDSNCAPTVCGNGVAAGDEECDDGNPSISDDCTPDCRAAWCGDGNVNVRKEQCDDGNRENGDLCTNACTEARCGDGVIGPYEECDDGNRVNDDGCDAVCVVTGCGNDVLNEGEECDDGNTSDLDDCVGDCRVNVCGDGFRRSLGSEPERCDDGNLIDGDGCDSTCKPTGCGSGVVTGDEQCDDGNTRDDDRCRANCTHARCGDGVRRVGIILVDPGEECDDGNLVQGDGCDTTCKRSGCGSGAVSGSEQCDDGNGNNNDACLNDCTAASCGDGELYAGIERCDDGNTSAGDGCSPECRLDGECADADLDGKVTATDARSVLVTSVNPLVVCPPLVCDVDASGLVDTRDALAVLRLAVGLYDASVCRRPALVVVRLLDEREVVGIQVAVEYEGAPGVFVGDGGAVQCSGLVSGSLSTYHHDSAQRVLLGGMITLAGMSGPMDLFSCVFERYGPDGPLALDAVSISADGGPPGFEPLQNVHVEAVVP